MKQPDTMNRQSVIGKFDGHKISATLSRKSDQMLVKEVRAVK